MTPKKLEPKTDDRFITIISFEYINKIGGLGEKNL